MCEDFKEIVESSTMNLLDKPQGFNGVWVLYDEPSKMRPKTMRSNSWIKLNEAKVRNIKFRVDLSKNAT